MNKLYVLQIDSDYQDVTNRIFISKTSMFDYLKKNMFDYYFISNFSKVDEFIYDKETKSYSIGDKYYTIDVIRYDNGDIKTAVIKEMYYGQLGKDFMNEGDT